MIFPPGTQVVTKVAVRSQQEEVPAGSVGTIAESPSDNSHKYRIALLRGGEAVLQRHEFAILKHFKGLMEVESVLQEYNLQEYILYQCVVGSQAYGLSDEHSDTDRRGIYLPPADYHWSLYGVPEQLENKQTDECYWELQKFMILALKANPNVLECLYTPLVLMAKPLAEELLGIKGIFLSKLIFQTYNGYVISQFRKLEQDIRTRGEVRWKHAMHLIRLLLSGIELLRTGFLTVSVEAHKPPLLAIKRAELPWEQVNQWRIALQKEFEEAFLRTSLPERPDYERANRFLTYARRQMV